jgi:hypothetical protein
MVVRKNVLEYIIALVVVKKSPIFKDRFFLQYGNILGNGVKQNV